MKKILSTVSIFGLAVGSVFALGACNSKETDFHVEKPAPMSNAAEITGSDEIEAYNNAHEGKEWSDFGYKAYTFIVEDNRDEIRLTKKETIDFESKTYRLEEQVFEKDESGNYQKKASLKANRFSDDNGYILTFDISFKDCKIPNTSKTINGELNGYMTKFQPYFSKKDSESIVVFDGIPYTASNVYASDKESYLYYEYDSTIEVYKNDLLYTAYLETEFSTVGAKFEYYTTSKKIENVSIDGRELIDFYVPIEYYGARNHLYDDILSLGFSLLETYFTVTEAEQKVN